MDKRLENPVVMRSAWGLFLALSLTICQTIWAETPEPTHDTSASKTEASASPEDKKDGKEKIRAAFKGLPDDLLRSVSKSLAQNQKKLTPDEFKNLVNESLKAVTDPKVKAEADKSAQDLIKVFTEQSEVQDSNEKEFNNAALEENIDRFGNRKPGDGTEPDDKGDDKGGDGKGDGKGAGKDDKDKKEDPALDALKKQLADLEEKAKNAQANNAGAGNVTPPITPPDTGAGDQGQGNQDTGAGTGSGSGSGGGGSPSGGGSGSGSGKGDSQAGDQPKSEAAQKLQDLANALSSSTDDEEPKPTDDKKSDFTPSKSRSKDTAKTDPDPEPKDDKIPELPKEPKQEVAGPPPPPPATSSLPAIPDIPQGPGRGVGPTSGGSAGGFGSPILAAASAMGGGSGGGDFAFNPGGGAMMKEPKNLNFKYLRVGSEAYGSGSGSLASGDSYSDGGSYGPASSPRALAQARAIAMSEGTGVSTPPEQNGIMGYVFSFPGKTVRKLCGDGNLVCRK